jgi:hypothetical protein
VCYAKFISGTKPCGSGLARDEALADNITFRLARKNPEAFTVRVFVFPASISG